MPALDERYLNHEDPRDRRRFTAILLGLVVILILLSSAWQRRQGVRRLGIEALAGSGANRAEFEDLVGLPDEVYINLDGEECWLYELDRNPYQTVCFEAESGDFAGASIFWID